MEISTVKDIDTDESLYKEMLNDQDKVDPADVQPVKEQFNG